MKKKEIEVKGASKLNQLHKVLGGTTMCLTCGLNGHLDVAGISQTSA